MKNILSFFVALLSTASLTSQAQQISDCAGNLVKPVFNFQQEIVELDKAAFSIGARWTQDNEWTSLEISERLKRREAAIEEVYAKLRERRKDGYLAASCKVSSIKNCASTPGKKHYCPMSIDVPSDTYFVQGTLTKSGKDFDISPRISKDGKNVSYTVKKTGKGHNTAGFTATVRFIPGLVNSWVDKEVARAQDYLAPLLRAQNLNVSGSVQVNPEPGAPNTCVSDFERLGKLRTSGILSEEEFRSAKAALKHCFR